MKVTFDIRPAERNDIALDKINLRFGQVFFIKSMITQKFEGPYKISELTDPQELGEWFKFEMIYVPVNAISNNVTVNPLIHEQTQRTV